MNIARAEICSVKSRGGEAYGLIFLDIFMEETDGLEIGGEIRRRFPETELVFVSVSREFGPEAIDLDALYYLVKPYRRGLLFKIKKRFHRIHMPQLEVYDADIRQNQKIPYRIFP